MPKQLPTDLAEALIEAVRKRDVLYNTSNERYRSRHSVEMAWQGVADEVFCDVSMCKSMWASLRGMFNRRLSMCTPGGSGPLSEKKKHKWRFFQPMLFLKDHVSHGLTATIEPSEGVEGSSNGGDSQDQQDFYQDSEDTGMADTDNLTVSFATDSNSAGDTGIKNISLTPSDSTPASDSNCGNKGNSFTTTDSKPTGNTTTSSPRVRGVKRKTVHDDPVQQAVSSFLASAEQTGQVEDQDAAFFHGILPYFKKLPPSKKLQCMHQFTGILMELVGSLEDNNFKLGYLKKF